MFGSIALWSIFSLVILFELFLVLRENPWGSTVTPSIFIAFVAYFCWPRLTSMLSTLDWRLALIAVVVYFVIGFAWCLFRWRQYAVKRRTFFVDLRRKWAVDHNVSEDSMKTWPNARCYDFLRYFCALWNDNPYNKGTVSIHEPSLYCPMDIREKMNGDISDGECKHFKKQVFEALVPKVKNDRARIYLWICFWPFSLLGYFIEDILADFGRWLVRCVSSAIRYINKVVFASLKQELGV